MHEEMTDAQVLALCKSRLPRAKETAALTAMMLAWQYTTKGVPEHDDDGNVVMRPPTPNELSKLAQAVKWCELPDVPDKSVSDETIIDAIEKAGMVLPRTVTIDTSEDAL